MEIYSWRKKNQNLFVFFVPIRFPLIFVEKQYLPICHACVLRKKAADGQLIKNVVTEIVSDSVISNLNVGTTFASSVAKENGKSTKSPNNVAVCDRLSK